MRAVGVVGASGAGKTTLIERLIPVLGERGRVATIKSIHHDVEVDDEGKDTHRHRTAGAGRVVGVTPSLTFSVEPVGKGDRGEGATLRLLLRGLDDDGFDYVLVEGFTAARIPKLAVGDDPPDGVGGIVPRRVPDAGAADPHGIADWIDHLAEWDPT